MLTQAEREQIREIETLKNEIRLDLMDASEDSGFFRHPAVLLVLGFVLTAGLGSWLTYFWNKREWNNQQAYLVNQRFLQKKYEVIDETFKAIAESNTGAEDTLANYEWQNWKRKEIEERRAKWRSSSRDWRIESKSLREKLGIYFADPSIQSTFEEIVLKRRHAGNIITNLLTNNIESKSKADAAVHEATGLLTETVALLNKLGNAMAHEVKGDSAIAPKANRLQIPNFNDLDQVMPESP